MVIRLRIPKPKKGPHSRILTRFVWGALIFSICGAAYSMVADGGLLEVLDAQSRAAQMQARLVEMERGNRVRLQEIHRLRTDPEAIERIAREELQMARPGDTVYLLPPDERSATPDRRSSPEELDAASPTAPSMPYRR